jgi:hypothetical protein
MDSPVKTAISDPRYISYVLNPQQRNMDEKDREGDPAEMMKHSRRHKIRKSSDDGSRQVRAQTVTQHMEESDHAAGTTDETTKDVLRRLLKPGNAYERHHLCLLCCAVLRANCESTTTVYMTFSDPDLCRASHAYSVGQTDSSPLIQRCLTATSCRKI